MSAGIEILLAICCHRNLLGLCLPNYSMAGKINSSGWRDELLLSLQAKRVDVTWRDLMFNFAISEILLRFVGTLCFAVN